MLDDIKHGLRRCGHSYGAVARATGGTVSERTIYTLFADDANPTIGTLNALADVLCEIPDQNRLPCDGCRHVEFPERLDFGAGETDVVACRMVARFRPNTGCAMRRTQ